MQVMVTDQVTLTVNKKLKMLEQQWHSFAYGKLLREATDYSTHCITHYRLNYLLADTSNAKPLTQIDRGYYVGGLKKMQLAGLKQFIAIKPTLPHTIHTLLCIQRELENILPVRVFETRQDAIITIQRELLDNNQLSLF